MFEKLMSCRTKSLGWFKGTHNFRCTKEKTYDTIEWKKLEELELEHMRYGYHEHQYAQQVYDEL